MSYHKRVFHFILLSFVRLDETGDGIGHPMTADVKGDR